MSRKLFLLFFFFICLASTGFSQLIGGGSGSGGAIPPDSFKNFSLTLNLCKRYAPPEAPEGVVNMNSFKECDGSGYCTMTVYSRPHYYQDDSGVWRDVQPFEIAASGTKQICGTFYNLAVSDSDAFVKFNDFYFLETPSLYLDGAEVTKDSKLEEEAGWQLSEASYKLVFEDTWTGFKKEYVIDDNATLSGVSNIVVEEDVVFSNETNITLTTNGLLVKSINQSFYFKQPYAYDSANASLNLNYTVEKLSDTEYIFRINTSSNWFKNGNRVYPVYLDPSTNPSVTGDAPVDSSNPTTNYGGTTNAALGQYCGGSPWKHRGYYAFTGYDLGSGAVVTSASFQIYRTSGTYDFRPDLYNTTSFSEGTITWNNKPSTGANYGGSSGCVGYVTNQWCTWSNVGSAVGQNATYLTAKGVEYCGSTDYDYFDFREATHDPALSITYTTGSTLTCSVAPSSPQNYGTNVTFTCFYNSTANSSKIAGATCNLKINGTNYSMTENANNYTKWNNTLLPGINSWNVSCNVSSSAPQNTTSSNYQIYNYFAYGKFTNVSSPQLFSPTLSVNFSLNLTDAYNAQVSGATCKLNYDGIQYTPTATSDPAANYYKVLTHPSNFTTGTHNYNWSCTKTNFTSSSSTNATFVITGDYVVTETKVLNANESGSYTYQLVFNFDPSIVSSIDANFSFNNSQRTVTSSSTAYSKTFSSTQVMPLVTTNNTNKTFNWTYIVRYVNGTNATNSTVTNGTLIQLAYWIQALQLPFTYEVEGEPMTVNVTLHNPVAAATISTANLYQNSIATPLTLINQTFLTVDTNLLPSYSFPSEVKQFTANISLVGFESSKVLNITNSTVTSYQMLLANCYGNTSNTTLLLAWKDELTLANVSVNSSILFTAYNGNVQRPFTLSVTDTNYTFMCLSPQNGSFQMNMTATSRILGAPQRTSSFYDLNLTNTSQEIDIYMLGQGSTFTFHVINNYNLDVQNAIVSVYKYPSNMLVGSVTTDAAGNAPFFLEVAATHTVNVSAVGYYSVSFSYTTGNVVITEVQLQPINPNPPTPPSNYDNVWQCVQYSITPNAGTYTHPINTTFYINSNTSCLQWWGWNVSKLVNNSWVAMPLGYANNSLSPGGGALGPFLLNETGARYRVQLFFGANNNTYQPYQTLYYITNQTGMLSFSANIPNLVPPWAYYFFAIVTAMICGGYGLRWGSNGAAGIALVVLWIFTVANMWGEVYPGLNILMVTILTTIVGVATIFLVWQRS